MARRNRIKDRLTRVYNRIQQVRIDLSDIKMDTPSMVANYTGMNVTGGEETSYVERTFILMEIRLQQEFMRLKQRYLKLRERIRNLDEKWEGIQYIIDNALTEEERFIAEQKYLYQRSLRQIVSAYREEYGEIKHHDTISEIRKRLVEKVMDQLKIVA